MIRLMQSASALTLVAALAAAPVAAIAQTQTQTQPQTEAEQAAGTVVQQTEEAAGAAAKTAGEATEAAGQAVEETAQEGEQAAGEAAQEVEQTTEGATQEVEVTTEGAGETKEVEAEVVQEGEPVETAVEGEAEVAAPVEGTIVLQDENSMLTSDLLDAAVYNSAGEKIGDIDDAILSLDGTVEGVVIGVGGFLGIGEKHVAVEMQQISLQTNEVGEPQLILETTKEALEAAPEFVTAEDQQDDAAMSAGGTAPADTGMAPAATGTVPAQEPAATTTSN